MEVTAVTRPALERLALSSTVPVPIDTVTSRPSQAGPPSSVVARMGTSDATGAPVVQFVDRRTGEVVVQLPPEAVLRIVEQLVDRARQPRKGADGVSVEQEVSR